VEGAIWTLPSGKLIQGTVRVSHCGFRNCTFENIGWVSDDPEALKAQLAWMYDGDPTPPQDWVPPHSDE
jgi:hypothetical protein